MYLLAEVVASLLGLMGNRPLVPAAGAAVTARKFRQAHSSEEK